jgi:flagellar basal-body rod modification protein FlgD
LSRIPVTTPIQQTTPNIGRQTNDLRDVGVDQFLQLMIAELQNQDPLNPLDNSELVQQISQIREISATNQLSETLSAVLLGQNMTTASSLIGKRITALTDDIENVEGVVDRVSVTIDDNDEATRVLRVHVGEHSIQLDNVREIITDETGE